MTDTFKGYADGLNSPPTDIFAVAPDDASNLPYTTRCLNVATAGAVRVTTAGGSTQTIFVAAGITFPVRVTRVWATGTTATGIMGLF